MVKKVQKKRFRKQSFKKLLKESTDVGLPFSDQTFKCEDKSVAITSQFRTQLDVGKIVWKRPKDIVDIPHLLHREKLGPAQEVEFVGDGPIRWFIGAALAITTDKNVLFRVIPKSQTHFLRGILKFNFWHLGDWLKVVVDDRLPTFDNKLVFSSSRCQLVYWVPLLEKAYAKLHGSYEVMATNSCFEYALMDMTGATVETIPLEKDGKEREQFRMICEELDKKAIICAKSKESVSSQNAYGLLNDCIYVIKNIKKPLSGTFRKTFSKDESKESPSVRIMCTVVNKKKNFSTNSQSERLQDFWIPIEEFCKSFESLTFCRTYSRDRESVCCGDSSTQFCFDVTTDSNEVMIDLMQKNYKDFVALGFNLYKAEVNRNYKLHNLNRIPIVYTEEATKKRNIFKRIELSPGRYVLTAICLNPDLQLILRVLANKSTNLKILSQDMPRKNLLPFVAPKYPNFVTRITVISANSLEKQDRFGAANPYCVVRCGRQVVKSAPIAETLNPEWDYFSAIFYHNRFASIVVEVWHQSLLIDYFMGRVEVLPKMAANTENVSSIQELELTGRKNEIKSFGSIKLQLFTYEDLRAF